MLVNHKKWTINCKKAKRKKFYKSLVIMERVKIKKIE